MTVNIKRDKRYFTISQFHIEHFAINNVSCIGFVLVICASTTKSNSTIIIIIIIKSSLRIRDEQYYVELFTQTNTWRLKRHALRWNPVYVQTVEYD